MALPAGVTTRRVFMNPPVSFSGDPGSVEFFITPSERLVYIDPATGASTPLVDFIEAAEPAEGVVAETVLPHTDQENFFDEAGNAFTNWHYTARIRLKKQGQQQKHQPLFDFQIPTGSAEVDLAKVPRGVAAVATVAPVISVTSINGSTGAVELEYATYLQLARTPEQLIVGAITLDGNGAPTSAAVAWPDGTAGVFTGTVSAAFPGSLDSYTITYGTSRIYTQPTVTRDASGNITTQPAITEETL